MYSIIFGLFSLAFLLFFGMVHTFRYIRKIKKELECKNKYVRYASILGISGSVSLIMAVLLYNYGIG